MGATCLGGNEVLAHALANTSQEDVQAGFAVKRGSEFVNEYPRQDEDGSWFDGGPENPNHMLGAYPTLWPRGMGGIETSRPINVPYNIHVRSLLQQPDKGFRKDNSFIFQAFGVLQKRQVCTSAALQVQRKTFTKHSASFRALTPKDLLLASQEEVRKAPFSNPVIRALRGELSALRSKVMGTDESRIRIRSQIKGMTVKKGPPSLWITLNPSDTGDPIAQVIAGEEIDLDNFEKTSGPNSDQRSMNISEDPYAAAKFFHFIIQVIIEELFGVKAGGQGHSIKRNEGIFGEVAAYVGTVEAQGRGTLHLHIVVWLSGALSSSEMKEALQSDKFRRKVSTYIATNIRADIHGANAAAVNRMPREKAVSYSRTCDPRKPLYEELADAAETTLARAVQHHKCSAASCLVSKFGRVVCKRRAPFSTSNRDFIDPDGQWGTEEDIRVPQQLESGFDAMFTGEPRHQTDYEWSRNP